MDTGSWMSDRPARDDHDLLVLHLIMHGFFFTCLLLLQFCLSLISASRVVREKVGMSRETGAYSRQLRLQNQCTHRFLQIIANRVNANGQSASFSELRFQSDPQGRGFFTIEAVRYPDSYLCFDRTGKLVVRAFGHKRQRCKFIENMTHDHYSVFHSVANKDWRIGFKKKNGEPLKGYKNRRKDDCFKFQKINHTPYSEAAGPAVQPDQQGIANFKPGFDMYVKQQLMNTETVTAAGRGRISERRRNRRRKKQTKRPRDDNT